MAIVSAFTMIRSLSLFHITLAFFFLTAPRMIADQNLVYILGESMKVPHSTAFDKPSSVTAFLAVMFAFLGVSDLVSVSLEDEIAREYWASVIPTRLLVLFGLSGYTYTFKEGGIFGPKTKVWGAKPSPGDHLQNSVMFTWAFMEMVAWFWVFITFRDERRQAAVRLIEKRKKEAEGWRTANNSSWSSAQAQ